MPRDESRCRAPPADVRFIGAAAVFALAACATVPLAPDPAIDPTGRWTITAVNGEPTGGGRRFNFELNPGHGRARFGCNAGGGTYRIANGWLVAGEWIVTVAACPDRQSWVTFERKGFQILASPLAMEKRDGGLRLRNQIGSIDLVRAPPLRTEEIVGRWAVVSVNEIATPGASFRMIFTSDEFDAQFGCNSYLSTYVLENGRIRGIQGRQTEKACDLTGPDAPQVPVMQIEGRAFAILGSQPEISIEPGGGLSLTSSTGTIELSRLP